MGMTERWEQGSAASRGGEATTGQWSHQEVPMSAADPRPDAVPRVQALIPGTSQASKRLFSEVQKYARTPYSILLVGPTGVGKTAIAELMHQWSSRSKGPFIPCPLPAIPEDLRHAELSGTAPGAFTGATADRAGLVEAASGGTLFLDELSHASLQLQQALLTILESQFVQRVGETRRRRVDTRFIMASSVDLVELCGRGRFLEELLYRVEGFTIRVPTLQERREDIVPMAERFIAQAFEELGRVDQVLLSAALRESLASLTWPGNVRQLRTTCRRLAVHAQPDTPIDVSDLMRASDQRASRATTLRERALEALGRAAGNKAKAARALNVTRARLYRLLAED